MTLHKRLVALFLASSVIPTNVYAASFNCTKAATTIEKTICSDPALSSADDKLDATYKAALVPLSREGKKQMQAGQRSWLHYVQTVCSENPNPSLRSIMSLPQRRTYCLKQEYDGRQKQLDTAIFRTGNLVIQRYDQFFARAADDDSGSHSGFVAKQISYPQIDDPKDAEERDWNEFIKKFANNNKRDEIGDTTDIYLDYIITAPVSGLLSTSLSSWYYGHGAAHGYGDTYTYNWLLQGEREIRPYDLFDASRQWSKALETMSFDILNELNVKEDKGYTVQTPDQLKDLVADPQRWTIEADGLGIQFNVYELGSYASGAPKIVIPWERLKPYLAANALVPAPIQSR